MLKRRTDSEATTWHTSERLGGRVLLCPLTARLAAEFQRKRGTSPKGYRTTADGSTTVQIEHDPVRVLDADVWVLGKLVKDIEAPWDDGSPMTVGAPLFEAIHDDAELLNELLDAAVVFSGRREAAASGN